MEPARRPSACRSPRALAAAILVVAAGAGVVTRPDVVTARPDGPPAYPVGGGAATLRAASGVRTVVVVGDDAALGVALQGVTPDEVWHEGVLGFVAALDDAAISRLRAVPGVRSVEPDRRLGIAGEQLNPPWGLDRIDQRDLPLDSSYTYPLTGTGVTAYVIDSGIWASHTEFTGRIPYGFYWDFGDGSGITDCNGHGTHVAGTLGGTTYGVAKQVTIVPVKVLDCDGYGTTSSVIAGINDVIDDHPAGVPAVANMSVGGPASGAVDAAVQAMIADGIAVVVAAGNDSVDACTQSPGRVPDAITVAASTAGDDDAWFSNYGACNDLFAPGVGVRSALPGAGNTTSGLMSGTSMASPHVAGVSALVLQSAPAATPADVWTAIEAASTKGVVSECCGDPDKLLYVPQLAAPPPARPATTAPTTSTTTTVPSAPPTDPPTPDPSAPAGVDLTTVQPARLYDSRSGSGARPAGSVTEVQVAGSAGVPADAALAALNVTAVAPADAGYLTVFPCGIDVPNASNVNFAGGQTIPNAALVRIGDGGRICVFTSAPTDLLVDVNGYAPSTTRLTALQPARLFDSRGTGAPRPAGSVAEIQVAGAGGVGADATMALLNVTAVDALDDGYLTVFPCGTAPPNASNVNFRRGQTIANAAVGRLGVDGTVCVFTSAAAGVLVDVTAAAPAGATVVAVDPHRLLDTRQLGGPVAAGSITRVQVTATAGVPAGARTAVLNVTALDAAGVGYFTVFPCDAPLPNASNLNVAAGDTMPNAVVAGLAADGAVCVYASVAAGLLVDIGGYA